MRYRCNEENKRKQRLDGRVTQVELPPGYGVIMSPVRYRPRPYLLPLQLPRLVTREKGKP